MGKAILSPPHTPLVRRGPGLLHAGVQKGVLTHGHKGRRVFRSLDPDFEEALRGLGVRPFTSPSGMKKPTFEHRAPTGQPLGISNQTLNQPTFGTTKLLQRKGPLAGLRSLHMELDRKPPTPITGRTGMRVACDLDALTFHMSAKLALDSHASHMPLTCASSAQVGELNGVHLDLGLSKYNSCHI